MKIYTCVCGKSFETPNSFNGHKSRCEKHLKSVGKWEEKLKRDIEISSKISASISRIHAEKHEASLTRWLDEKHTCERCGKIMTSKYGSGRFCCVSCANGGAHTDKTKEIIGTKVKVSAERIGKKRHEENVQKYEKAPKHCVVCGNILPYTRRTHKTCGSEACIKFCQRKGGLQSIQAQANTRRSKNEMLFAEKCIKQFKHVDTNANIFFGWDADVIIHDYKIAVLWNGSWHFDKLTKQHSVEQVQNRDRMKIQAIKDSGYVPYVIEDHGSFDKLFVEEQFQELLKFINAPCPRRS